MSVASHCGGPENSRKGPAHQLHKETSFLLVNLGFSGVPPFSWFFGPKSRILRKWNQNPKLQDEIYKLVMVLSTTKHTKFQKNKKVFENDFEISFDFPIHFYVFFGTTTPAKCRSRSLVSFPGVKTPKNRATDQKIRNFTENPKNPGSLTRS